MSIKLMSMIFEIKDQLSPTQKLVMLELSDHANDLGGGIWPGWDTIGDRTSLKRTAVRDTLAFLTEAGILQTVTDPTPSSSTRRQINVKLLEELIEYGRRGIDHPVITKTKLAVAEREAEKKKNKSKGVSLNDTGVSLGDTAKNDPLCRLATQGVSPEDTAVSPEDTAVSPGVPESSLTILNHQGNGDGRLPDPQIWQSVLFQLRTEMHKSDFDSWVTPLSFQGLIDGAVHIGAINAYGRDWVQSRLGTRLQRLFESVYERPVLVQVDLVQPAG